MWKILNVVTGNYVATPSGKISWDCKSQAYAWLEMHLEFTEHEFSLESYEITE